jgi:two-component system response regulator YesN
MGNRQMQQCIDLIKSQYHDPELNITAIARQIEMHRTNLSKLFKDKMKMSPIEYLSLYRVGKAMQLIQASDLTFAQIAAKTGFACPNYFTNVIRKRTGSSPTELRQHARSTQTTNL